MYFHLSANIWLTPLMLIGTQWYVLFNVIAGAAAFPGDMREAVANFRVRGFLWWRKVMIPGILPYFITGAITASGGAWNASIVADLIATDENMIAPEFSAPCRAELLEALRRKSQAVEVELVR